MRLGLARVDRAFFFPNGGERLLLFGYEQPKHSVENADCVMVRVARCIPGLNA